MTDDIPRFFSRAHRFGHVELPEFTGIRVMMMPFHVHDPLNTLPSNLMPWAETLTKLCDIADVEGTGYLTIDEAHVRAGETHRRPGLHVDGIGEDGNAGGWGGGGGYGAEGMLTVSSHVGCRVFRQMFHGAPGADGDCAHLAGQADEYNAVDMQPGDVWWCGALAVHEALPMPMDTQRQFCRLSFPSRAPWHEGYTRNPLGIEPAGPVLPRREKQMAFRAEAA